MNKKKYLKKLKKEYEYTPADIKRIKKRLSEIKDNRSFITLKFIIHHEPIPQPRPRMGRYTVYVPGAAVNKKKIQNIIKEYLDDEYKEKYTDIICNLDFFLKTPKSYSKVDRYLSEARVIRPPVKPDVDNLMKTYLDACNGFIWFDDGQIVDSRIRKYYSTYPRVELTIKFRKGFLSPFLKRATKNKKHARVED